jgi:hypothetical protein
VVVGCEVGRAWRCRASSRPRHAGLSCLSLLQWRRNLLVADRLASIHREKYRPCGGPDGGNGGRGGEVVTLAHFKDRIHWKAEAGKAGSSSNKRGRNGRHLIVRVPPGTVVKDLEGVVWADLANPGDRLIASRGGAGGRGNASFATPRRRLPSFWELGQEGKNGHTTPPGRDPHPHTTDRPGRIPTEPP